VTLAARGRSPHAIEGRWRPVAAWIAGEPMAIAELRVACLVLARGWFQIIDHAAQVADSGEYRLLAESDPPAIDIEGAAGPHAGRRLRAIYNLSPDLLSISYDLQGGPRPLSSEPEPSTGDPDTEQLLLTITYARERVLDS
jgi:uncharacterized protein (TIGR03067 family)